jgi:hypothetical protein
VTVNKIKCIRCDKTYAGEPEDTPEKVWSDAVREGWRSRKVEGCWGYYCPKHGVTA